MKYRYFFWVFTILVTFAWSQDELWEMSIEELMDVPVVSVNQRTIRLGETLSAVSVISSNELEMTGMDHLVESLRYVPGMHVARGTSNIWSVTSRGFPGRFANKLLVIKDGQDLYSPSYSGVFWELVNWDAANIDRIEIVRGPGGASWGVNAVNGVINIISKTAFDTLGSRFRVTHNLDDHAALHASHGLTLGNQGALRISANLQGIESPTGDWDDLETRRVSLRYDYVGKTGGHWSVFGEGFESESTELNQLPTDMGAQIQKTLTQRLGAHLGFVHKRDLSENLVWDLKGNIEGVDVDWSIVSWKRKSMFLESRMTHDFNHNSLVWGGGLKWVRFTQEERGLTQLKRSRANPKTYNFFLQGDSKYFGEALHLTLGTKLEYLTEAVGFVYEPSVKLAYQFDAASFLWAGFSRSIRSPSTGELEIDSLFGGFKASPTPLGVLPLEAYFVGGEQPMRPEVVKSWEMGWRQQFGDRVSLNLNLFWNKYSDVIYPSKQPSSFQFDPQRGVAVAAFAFTNVGEVKSEGIELQMNCVIRDGLLLKAVYSYMSFKDRYYPQYWDGIDLSISGDLTPEHAASVQVQYHSKDRVSGFVGLRYVDSIGTDDGYIDSYFEADAQIRIRLNQTFELALLGKNLMGGQHKEFSLIHELLTFETAAARQYLLEFEIRF